MEVASALGAASTLSQYRADLDRRLDRILAGGSVVSTAKANRTAVLDVLRLVLATPSNDHCTEGVT